MALDDEDGDVLGLAAAWSFAHGFAALLVHGNLPPELGTDEELLAPRLAAGLTQLVASTNGPGDEHRLEDQRPRRSLQRDPSANADDAATTAATGSVDDLAKRKYCVVVTHRRNGQPTEPGLVRHPRRSGVPTPPPTR